MLYREISRVLAPYLYVLSGVLFLALILAGSYQFLPLSHPQPHCFWAFLWTLLICLALAGLCQLGGRKAKGTFFRREGLVLVVIIWFITALIGALPFIFSNTFSNPVDAYFEAMSGLTTTGASAMTAKQYNREGEEIPIVHEYPGTPPALYTYYGTIQPVRNAQGTIILSGVEAVSKTILMWRSFLQWLGGMGIVMLFLAILPALGVGGKVLYQAEVPGPLKDAMTPRIRDTASLLWKLYLFFTALEIILLMTTNTEMALFDAIAITFSSLSTGGFTVKNGSIGAYHSLATEVVVMAFMFLGSINFALYAYLLRRKLSRLKDPEFFAYCLWLVVMIVLMTLFLTNTRELLLTPAQHGAETFSWLASLRYGAFQLISIQTSTGMATANFDIWPFTCQVILLTVMFIGGMSGSTAGGVKVIRHVSLFRLAKQKIDSIFQPHAVRTLRIGSSTLSTEQSMTVLNFFFIIVLLTVIGTFLLVVNQVDPETALSVTASNLNNIGVAFRLAGPAGSFAFLSPWGKILSILYMVLGRLELFAVLIIFIPAFWRRK